MADAKQYGGVTGFNPGGTDAGPTTPSTEPGTVTRIV